MIPRDGSGVDSLPPAIRGPAARFGARTRRWVTVARARARALGPRIRRSIDIVVALAALAIAGPIIVLAGLAMKITSRGPMLYAQQRIGRGGRPFKMYKLRSMSNDADAQKTALALAHAHAVSGVRFKLRVDPRVTRVGRILRKLSIDELPQLWNVLRGDMTLVGPRPAVWREVHLYDPRALRRLEVVPGLTCLWQVRGRSNLSFEEQVTLDIEYIDRVRWAEEVRIVLATVPAVVAGRGAY